MKARFIAAVLFGALLTMMLLSNPAVAGTRWR